MNLMREEIGKFFQDYYSLFNIAQFGNNGIVLKYIELLKTLSLENIEFSIKIQNAEIYPYRLNCYCYMPDINSGYAAITDYMKWINSLENCRVNFNLFEQAQNILHQAEFDSFGIGIDIREKAEKTRFKVGWGIKRNTKAIAALLGLHGYNNDMVFLTNNFIGCAVHFTVQNQTALRIYNVFSENMKDELSLLKLRRIFDEKIIILIQKCNRFFIAYEGKSFEKIIHFRPYNVEEFVRSINNKTLNEVYMKYKAMNFIPKMISLHEKDILENNFNEINLYYLCY